jgi:hypothetical protein
MNMDPLDAESLLKLVCVPRIANLDGTRNANARNIRPTEDALVTNVLHTCPGLRDGRGEISKTSRPIADCRGELNEPSVNRKRMLNDACQYEGINISPAEKQHHTLPLQLGKFAGEQCCEWCSTGTLDDTVLHLDKP